MNIETIKKQHLIKVSEAKVGDVIVPENYLQDDDYYYLVIYMDANIYNVNKGYNFDLKDVVTTINLESGIVKVFPPEEKCKVFNAKIVIERDM